MKLDKEKIAKEIHPFTNNEGNSYYVQVGIIKGLEYAENYYLPLLNHHRERCGISGQNNKEPMLNNDYFLLDGCKREIVVKTADSDYRVLCRFGYSSMIPIAWWGYVQKKITYKKFFLFGEVKEFWKTIDYCWWSYEMVSMEKLEKAALKLYHEKVLLKKEIVSKAMNLK